MRIENSSGLEAGRNRIYDIIKGLGILSIVIGHCYPSTNVIRFVYGYHVAIFIFVAGLQFNDAKYAENPSLLVQNRIKTMWPGYFCYMTFFTLTSHLFFKVHMLDACYTITKREIISRVVNNFFFNGAESMGGAMWFVRMILCGSIVFSIVVFLSTRFFRRYRVIPIVAISLTIGIIGLYADANKYYFIHHANTAFLLIPLMLFGYLISLHKINLEKILLWPIAVVTFALFVYFTLIKKYFVNLASCEIVSMELFFPITICGIYSVCYGAKILNKLPYFGKVFAFLGKYSFDIMALHFTCFKLIDVIYGNIRGDSPKVYEVFPTSYPKLWPVYLGVSLVVCPLVRIGVSKGYTAIQGFCQMKFQKKT